MHRVWNRSIMLMGGGVQVIEENPIAQAFSSVHKALEKQMELNAQLTKDVQYLMTTVADITEILKNQTITLTALQQRITSGL